MLPIGPEIYQNLTYVDKFGNTGSTLKISLQFLTNNEKYKSDTKG